MILERLSSTNKPIYFVGDFNIDLLKSKTCDFSHNFLLSIQSYSFSPVIDKPTRVKWLQEGLNQTLASRAELTLWG